MRGEVIHLRGATEEEVMAKIFATYGPSAVIGEIRKVRKPGIYGWFKAREVEISIRIKPEEMVNVSSLKKFKKLINRIGHSIKAEQQNSYYQQWESALQEFDVQGQLAARILAEVQDIPWSRESAKAIIARSVQVASAPKTKTIALVGPTGSGKTTTLIKLAALNTYRNKKRTAIISVDTSRIGAVEQLKIYSRIIGIPLIVASSPGEMEQAREKFSDYDMILIDTPGKSPVNHLAIAELYPYFVKDVEVALVVSATSKVSDLLQVQKGFSCLNPSSLIITRTDETISLGSIASFADQVKLPISYLGTGQRIGEDLVTPDAQGIASLVVRGAGNQGREWEVKGHVG